MPGGVEILDEICLAVRVRRMNDWRLGFAGGVAAMAGNVASPPVSELTD